MGEKRKRGIERGERNKLKISIRIIKAGKSREKERKNKTIIRRMGQNKSSDISKNKKKRAKRKDRKEIFNKRAEKMIGSRKEKKRNPQSDKKRMRIE